MKESIHGNGQSCLKLSAGKSETCGTSTQQSDGFHVVPHSHGDRQHLRLPANSPKSQFVREWSPESRRLLVPISAAVALCPGRTKVVLHLHGEKGLSMSATVRPLSHAGLRTSHTAFVPFAEDSTTEMYFPSDSHEEALARMLFLAEEQERCGLLVGPAGSGKSTLLIRLHQQLRRSGRKSCRIDLAGLDHASLLHRLAVEFGVNPSPHTDPHELWDQIEQIISSAARVQQPWILLFDHANRLRPGALSLLEQLLYSPHSGGIVMLFASRPEEQTTLLKTLSEYASLRIELSVLTLEETQSYVEFALERGLVSTPEFTRDAVQLIARISGGLPRQINRLCRALLLAAQADLRAEIDSELVLSVTEELLGMRVSA